MFLMSVARAELKLKKMLLCGLQGLSWSRERYCCVGSYG